MRLETYETFSSNVNNILCHRGFSNLQFFAILMANFLSYIVEITSKIPHSMQNKQLKHLKLHI